MSAGRSTIESAFQNPVTGAGPAAHKGNMATSRGDSIVGVTMVVMIMMAMMMMIIFSTEEVFDQSMVYFSCNLGNILSQTC